MDGSRYQIDIILPAPNILCSDSFGSLRPEVSEWLDNLKGHWQWVHERPVRDGEALSIRFSDAREALLFKLTWGGS